MARQAALKEGGRQGQVDMFKRDLILKAARRVFAREGLDGASLRAIAREAGYSPAALYFHYAGKEEIYGTLLSQSLAGLREAVDAGRDGTSGAALAFFDYYDGNPRELEMGFYLFGGLRRAGLTKELDADLNKLLRDVLTIIEQEMTDAGMPRKEAEHTTAALFAHCVGLLILKHTGRLGMFGLGARAQFLRYLDLLNF
jgi:AcrR family transcriptional regulator